MNRVRRCKNRRSRRSVVSKRRRTVTRKNPRPARSALALAVALTLTPLTACSAGSLGSSSESSDGGTTITWLTGSDETAQTTARTIVAAFEKANPDITVELDGRPAGAEGDNLVKTRLQTGSMPDVFDYNSGSLFQQIAPEKNLTDLTGDAAVAAVDEAFSPQVSVGDDVYGVPYGTAFGGGVMYNKKVYEELGLEVPTTWAEFLANADAIKAAGKTAVIQTYGETWTAQLPILGDFHNVAAADPDWAQEYTANRRKYATDPVALAGFQHLQEIPRPRLRERRLRLGQGPRRHAPARRRRRRHVPDPVGEHHDAGGGPPPTR
nr:extracellular solute-binding protein [Kineococcus aurantiacus]